MDAFQTKLRALKEAHTKGLVEKAKADDWVGVKDFFEKFPFSVNWRLQSGVCMVSLLIEQ